MKHLATPTSRLWHLYLVSSFRKTLSFASVSNVPVFHKLVHLAHVAAFTLVMFETLQMSTSAKLSSWTLETLEPRSSLATYLCRSWPVSAFSDPTLQQILISKYDQVDRVKEIIFH